MKLVTIDYIVIILYFITLLVIGYFSSKKQIPEEFLISKRKLGILSGIATINASKTGAILLIFTAMLYIFGFSAIWYFIGAVSGYLLFIPFAVRLYKKSNASYYTLPEYFYHSYGKLSSYFASIITIIYVGGYLIINLIAASKVFEFFTGISFAISAIIVSTIILIYLLLAGFKAVVRTDMLQYFAIIFILLTFFFILSEGVTIPAEEWNFTAVGLTNITGFFLIGLLLPFGSPDLWQRVYAMSNIKTLKRSIFYSIGIHLFVALILTLVGLLVKTQLPNLDPDIALIHGFTQLLPAGLSGLAVIVFFAAFMSTIDTNVYTASSSLIQDFFKNISKKKTVSLIRLAIFGFLLFSTIITILLGDLIQATFIFTAFLIILAVPTIITWIKPAIQKTTLNFTFGFGIIALIFFLSIHFMKNEVAPILVIETMGGCFIGLIIGSIISYFKEKS